MKRLMLLIVLLSLIITACGARTTTLPPTPLPTAVPPLEKPGSWAVSFEHTFPAGSWGLGVHRYMYFIHCPVLYDEDSSTEWILFDVLEDSQLYPGPIYMRIAGMSLGKLAPATIQTLHPDQETIGVVTLIGLTDQVVDQVNECELFIRWDDKSPHILTPGEPFQP